MKHPIARTQNGIAVYVDLINSPAAAAVGREPRLVDMVRRILEQTDATTPVVRIESNMGKNVGYNMVVETSEADTILYAQLIRQNTFTRFVKNGKPGSTTYVSVILRRDDEGNYELNQLWLGRLRPSQPGSNDESVNSKPYWASHAFVLDTQPIQHRSVTKVCPY
jgi:hypothetical protein